MLSMNGNPVLGPWVSREMMKSKNTEAWKKKLSKKQNKVWHKPELVDLNLRATSSGKPYHRETGQGHAAPSA